ncbi:class I SAM-dependent methyltransferase [Pseudomonas brassicacearum]|nr:class I SAM-dependent methyltransferase [Pseudomonas brassicacearum]
MNTTRTALKHFNMLAARQAYAQGQNITELLRQQKQLSYNSPEIIEAAYDLQAGTYIDYVENNLTQAQAYAGELAGLLSQHLKPQDSLLDIGTGELTTLSLIARQLPFPPDHLYAFDISWSRVHKGMAFAQQHMGDTFERLTPFIADISEIPLLDKSVNITVSSHALEPNGETLSELLEELFRVTIDKLVLFEPCYEINSEQGRQRMDRLGYIKNIAGVVEQLGATLVEQIPIKTSPNPLNPTVCFVITPPDVATRHAPTVRRPGKVFSVPGSNLPLENLDGFYCSQDTGLCFPVLKSLPILKSSAAILASALMD